ncbi:DUF547 domain-containing protein [Denitrobaculum tricleocarpae]|uniref:DUF547 domain-containing protein n=1 Tax=Denitrobaculum tricleocarpae TaxID=2591009 RepID=UPI001C55028D|nr:DUF547 domain-containing protein [Denitrobaculum tricleocarpae]
MRKQAKTAALSPAAFQGSYRILLVGLISIALLVAAQSVRAAPSAELWERWSAHDPASTTVLQHDAWDAFLSRYVSEHADGVNRVDYAGVSRADKRKLADYIDALTATRVSGLNRAEQQAYWVNLYNALTVVTVLDAFPVASIRDIDISPGLFSDGPWGKKLVTIEGEQLSLDDIEHRILRPIWQDPRIHYAVNCASIGCPNLQTSAMTAANTEEFLDAGAVAYINHKRGAEIVGGRLVVSSIYDWFEEDFGGDDAGVIAHLKQYANPDLKAALADVTKVSDDRYDWDLNGTVAFTKSSKKRKTAQEWRSRGS